MLENMCCFCRGPQFVPSIHEVTPNCLELQFFPGILQLGLSRAAVLMCTLPHIHVIKDKNKSCKGKHTNMCL